MSHRLYVHPRRRYQDPDTLARKRDRRLPLDLELLAAFGPSQAKESEYSELDAEHAHLSAAHRKRIPFSSPIRCRIVVRAQRHKRDMSDTAPSYASRGCPTRNTVMTMIDVQFTCVPRRALQLPLICRFRMHSSSLEVTVTMAQSSAPPVS